MNATVADGFKFGCGFILAQIILIVVLSIIMGLVTLVAGGILGTLLKDLSSLGVLVLSFV